MEGGGAGRPKTQAADASRSGGEGNDRDREEQRHGSAGKGRAAGDARPRASEQETGVEHAIVGEGRGRRGGGWLGQAANAHP